jgi:transposase
MDDSDKSSTVSDPRDARIAELTAKLEAALKRIAELEEIINRLQRGSKRQSAPFSKGSPKLNPKKPGRKPGENYGTPPAFRGLPPELATDEVIEVPPPQACPHCGDERVNIELIDPQVQVDLPTTPVVRRFKIRVARCACCGRPRRGRHPLQTSAATGCCAAQIGPTARAAMAFMNKTLGLSVGKIALCFSKLWFIRITRGGVSHAIQSIGKKCAGEYDSIVHEVQNATQVTCDETGWRVGGWGSWLHVASSANASAYLIDPRRGGEATGKLLPMKFTGTMVHDGWSPYDRYFDAKHQQCLAHLIRRCVEMLEVARGGAVVFPRRIKSIFKQALTLRDERDAGTRSLRSTKIHATKLTKQVRRLCGPSKTNPANEKLASFLNGHANQLFTFLRHEGIDATNWRGEQALRGAVVNRKVWGGNRTWKGARTQMMLLSVLRTLSQRGIQDIEWLRKKLLNQNPPMTV